MCDCPVIDLIGCLISIPKKTIVPSADLVRPICLLTTLHKLYATLVLQKVRERVTELVNWTQAGFIRSCLSSNNLWILRRVTERSIKFNVPVYCALVDYKCTFDALNCTTLCCVLGQFLSPSMVSQVLSIYFNAKAKTKAALH